MQWNEPYVHTEAIHVSSVQRVVTTPRRFHPGMGDLIVYYNGIYAIKGDDYEEISPYSIEFNYNLEVGDIVLFHYQKLW